ncbi:histone deacetylase 5-like [Pyrus ussuriensis x Pyrus communis]|uniref:Histone deacetylase 5-like n=1 Tax=Pyrus ussuriensis x Pyrus communis TaxID=2448454 RepID=A0A5N5EXP9_9ROSA|nr:histone deacetylase 5-like [Pyrus ussuriensis x Pyrus communis]
MATNTFITKLVEECNKYRDFINRNAIKSFQSEGDSSALHQTLGPLFKDNIPKSITNMLKAHCLKSIFQGYDWSKADVVTMVPAKKKLAPPSKNDVTIAPPSIDLTPIATPAAPTKLSKQPHPKAETTKDGDHDREKPSHKSKKEISDCPGIRVDVHFGLENPLTQRPQLRRGIECLNDLAINDLLSNENVVHLSDVLEQTR